jgi:outer membrane protein OmpA-like peptidoglycan-associated protein/uncharacterized protein YidB (DUF937 family)
MSMLDGISREAAQRFGLGDKAGLLVTSLLGFIRNSQPGGFTGFVDRFRQAGLGNQLNSWLGKGPNAELEPRQLEQVMGRDNVARIATSAGLSPAGATPALAFLVPKIIDLVTPDGVVPATLPAGLGGPTGVAAGIAGTAGGYADTTLSGVRNEPGTGSGLRKLIPILALILLGFLGWQLLGRNRSAGVERQTAAVNDSAYTEPAAPVDPAATPTTPTAGVGVDAGADVNADPRATVDAAMRRTSDALAALGTGYSARQLTDALNLNIVNFASGSAAIPAESRGVLNQSADAIQSAPAGTVLEIGGHTDNTGDPAANERLSQARADAVRRYLVSRGVENAMLTSRGYGAARPAVDNATDAGRFRNRRIEFTVVK